jgi:hypothetical protein
MNLCRAPGCGRAFERTTRLEAEPACPHDPCQRWLAAYAEALQRGVEPPAEFTLRRAESPQERRSARRGAPAQGSRRITRRALRIAHANELRQEARARARKEETIEAQETYL